MKEPKIKSCPICGSDFKQFKSTVKTCPNFRCALTYVRRKEKEKRQKVERRETKQKKEELKTKPQLTKEAQQAFNSFVRARDAGLPCISCGNRPEQKRGGTMECGHYRSVGACPELRFNELNAHLQCVKCNKYDSGNAVEYRLGLIDRIGQENVEWLESKHDMPNYTKEDLREIKRTYQQKARELRKRAA